MRILNPKLAWFCLAAGCLLPLANPALAQVALVNVAHIDFGVQFGGVATDVALSDDRLYLANGKDGVRVYDISDPSHPVHKGRVNVNGSGEDQSLVKIGNFVYSAGAELHIIDVGNFPVPQHVTSVPIQVVDLAGSGNHLFGIVNIFKTAGGDTLRAYEINNVTNVSQVGTTPTNLTSRITVSGSFAYLADWLNGFRIYDISDPAAPAQVGHTNYGGRADRTAVSGNHAYVIGDALRIYDVSNPANPTLLSSTTNNGFQQGIATLGNYVYAANSSGMRVYDVADPAQPVLVGQTATNFSGFAWKAVIYKHHLYVANGTDGVRIYSIEPQLLVDLPGVDTLRLSWAATGPFLSQENTQIAGTDWVTLTNLPVTAGSRDELVLSRSAAARFYRLISQ